MGVACRGAPGAFEREVSHRDSGRVPGGFDREECGVAVLLAVAVHGPVVGAVAEPTERDVGNLRDAAGGGAGAGAGPARRRNGLHQLAVLVNRLRQPAPLVQHDPVHEPRRHAPHRGRRPPGRDRSRVAAVDRGVGGGARHEVVEGRDHQHRAEAGRGVGGRPAARPQREAVGGLHGVMLPRQRLGVAGAAQRALLEGRVLGAQPGRRPRRGERGPVREAVVEHDGAPSHKRCIHSDVPLYIS